MLNRAPAEVDAQVDRAVRIQPLEVRIAPFALDANRHEIAAGAEPVSNSLHRFRPFPRRGPSATVREP